MDDTKSRAFRSRLTTILRALPCTRARVTRDRVTSPHPHPHPARHTGNSKLEKILVVLLLRWPCICLRCLLKIHPEPDLITALHGYLTLFPFIPAWPSGTGVNTGAWGLGRDADLPRLPIAGVSREPARSRRAGPGPDARPPHGGVTVGRVARAGGCGQNPKRPRR
jgi:hypothetical protein